MVNSVRMVSNLVLLLMNPEPTPLPNMKDLPALTESAAKNGQECKCEQVAKRGFTVARISCISQGIIFFLVTMFMGITCSNGVFSNNWTRTLPEKILFSLASIMCLLGWRIFRIICYYFRLSA
ncbi:MAG: hypothetical protein LE169_01655 [Endomicrobium sp.]|nr:hypothetical protein [Endomicrobium sp.]